MTKQLEAKFYAAGVIDTDGCCERVSDDEAQFWTVYERQQDGTSQAICDCDSRQGADAAAARFNALIAALERAQQQSENWRVSFDNERFRADKLAAAFNSGHEQVVVSQRALITQHVRAETAEKRIAELEASPLAVKLPLRIVDIVQLEKVMAALAVNGVEYKRSARVGEKANILSDAESEEHVIRQYRTVSSPWIQCSKQAYERKKANGLEVRVLHAQPQNQPQNIPEIIPDGWVMVPLKPTKEMVMASEYERGADWQCSVDIWGSMIAAAPKPE